MSRPTPPIYAEKISHIALTTVDNWPIKLLLFRGHSKTRLFAPTNRSYRSVIRPHHHIRLNIPAKNDIQANVFR